MPAPIISQNLLELIVTHPQGISRSALLEYIYPAFYDFDIISQRRLIDQFNKRIQRLRLFALKKGILIEYNRKTKLFSYKKIYTAQKQTKNVRVSCLEDSPTKLYRLY